MAKMTENSRKVFEYLKSAGIGAEFTIKQIQEALGFEAPSCVSGSVNSLVKKGFAIKTIKTVEVEDGKEKEFKYYGLTEAGMSYDPDAVEEK